MEFKIIFVDFTKEAAPKSTCVAPKCYAFNFLGGTGVNFDKLMSLNFACRNGKLTKYPAGQHQ